MAMATASGAPGQNPCEWRSVVGGEVSGGSVRGYREHVRCLMAKAVLAVIRIDVAFSACDLQATAQAFAACAARAALLASQSAAKCREQVHPWLRRAKQQRTSVAVTTTARIGTSGRDSELRRVADARPVRLPDAVPDASPETEGRSEPFAQIAEMLERAAAVHARCASAGSGARPSALKSAFRSRVSSGRTRVAGLSSVLGWAFRCSCHKR